MRLERRAVKVACVVLRGLGEGDLAWLPGGLSGSESSKLSWLLYKTKEVTQQ